MSGIGLPQWMYDDKPVVPEKYLDLISEIDDKFGYSIRNEGLGRRNLSEETGLSQFTARILIALIKNPEKYGLSSSVGLADEVEFTERGVVRDLPKLERWDRTDQIFKEVGGLSWDQKDDEISIEELIRRRERRFRELSKAKKNSKVRHINVKMHGPIAITHLGDPHVDDDGCNFPELRRTVETIAKTEAMYAGNIGDTVNNWIGRLERLYAKQTATYDEGIRLAEWLLSSIPYIYVLLGNHDLWGKTPAVLRQILKTTDVAVCTAGTAKIQLNFPKGEPVRLMARHDFKGSSAWNRAHGPLKAAKLDPWADVYVSGHKHHWVQHIHEGMDGKPRWSLTVRGYKYFDDFAEERGFYEHQHGESCTTIIDPTAKPTERVQCVWDIEEAADLLNYKRKRAGYK